MSDLVGRDQELALIASLLKEVAAEGGTLLFTGEPGVGKTALLDAAEEAAEATGLRVLRATGGEFGTQVKCVKIEGGRTMTENTTATETDVITKLSHLPVADTVSKLTGMIAAKGMKLFAVIDQAAEARDVGLTLRETVLVIFGSPVAGTPVMAASPLSALDLPLKLLIWSDDGQTKVSYYAPAALAARHHLPQELVGNLAGINGLTDALVAA